MDGMLLLFMILLIVLPIITWKREGLKQAILLFIGLTGLILFIIRDSIHMGVAIVGLITAISMIILGVILHFKKK